MIFNDRNLKFFIGFLLLIVLVNCSQNNQQPQPNPPQTPANNNNGNQDQQNKEKPKEKDLCPSKLLSNYQLDGLSPNEQSQDMIICKNIKAKNNCCSKLDEMKILINWSKYSEPKLNRYKDDILLAYEKVLNVDAFVKNMKGDLIDYHFQTYVWQKIKEKKCFNTKFFLEETKLDQLINEDRVSNWIDVWSKKIRQTIMTNFIDIVNKSKLMKPKDLKKYVVDPYYKNKKLLGIIKKLNDDFSLDSQIESIKKIVSDIFLSSPMSSFNFKGKNKKESNSEYLDRTLDYATIIKSIIFPQLQEKELRNLKRTTSQHQMKNIEKFFADNFSKIVDNKSIPNDKKVTLQTSIVSSIKSNEDLIYYLRFQYDPQIFDKNHNNYSTYLSVQGAIYESVEKSILDFTIIPNLNPYNLFQDTLKKMGAQMNVEQILRDKQYQVVLKPLMVKIYSELVRETVQNIEKRKLKEKQKEKLHKEYNTSFQQFKDLDFSKMKFEIKNYKKFEDLKQQISDKVESKWNLGQDQISADYKKKFKNSEIQKKFDEVLVTFKKMLEKDNYLTQKKGDKVCAEVTRHALVKRQNFNKEKYFYCAWAQKRLFNFNYETLLLEFEDIKSEIQKVLEMKKSLYCAICDKNLNKFIDENVQSITYSKDFCFKALTQYKKYLIWKNKLFIQYTNHVYQYLKCFASEGDVIQFPFKYFGDSDYKLVTQVEECTKLPNADKINMCLDLCQKFNIANYSAFWDGEKKFVERVYDFVLNVIRNYGFRFKKEEEIQIEKPIHIATNIDIADIQDLKKDEQQFIEDLTLNKSKTLFDYISMRVAKPKPKQLLNNKRILSERQLRRGGKSKSKSRKSKKSKSNKSKKSKSRKSKKSKSNKSKKKKPSVPNTSVPSSNYQKSRKFFKGFYKLYTRGYKDDANKWVDEYIKNLEKAKAYYYVKLIKFYREYYSKSWDYRKENRKRKSGESSIQWSKRYYTGYYEMQEKIQSKFYDDMKQGFPNDSARSKEYKSIVYEYIKKRNSRYKKYLKEALRDDGESYQKYRDKRIDKYYEYLKDAARIYHEYRITKRSYWSDSTHNRVKKYWDQWLKNRLELLDLKHKTRRRYREPYAQWRKRYLTALYAYQDAKKKKYFDAKTELYKNSPNSQKKMARLQKEIKAYERHKILRIRPGETKREHRERLKKFYDEELRKAEEERRKREEERLRKEEEKRKAEEERRRKAEEERRRKAEAARRAAEAGRRAAEGAARMKRKQARAQIRKDIDAQEIINYFDDKEKELIQIRSKELQQVQDKLKIKTNPAKPKQVKQTAQYKVADIQALKKILEKVVSKPKFTTKDYDKVDELQKGEDLIPKNKSIHLGQFNVIMAKDGLNLIEILNQTNFDINLLGTFLKEDENIKRTKEPLDREVIRDYLMANKPIVNAFNEDFNIEITKEFKSDEPIEEKPIAEPE